MGRKKGPLGISSLRPEVSLDQQLQGAELQAMRYRTFIDAAKLCCVYCKGLHGTAFQKLSRIRGEFSHQSKTTAWDCRARSIWLQIIKEYGEKSLSQLGSGGEDT